jgi:hypothetical protein
MRIEDQVCSFEQAEKLKALGVTTPSEFHWVLNSAQEDWRVVRKGSLIDFSFLPYLEAYTVAELGILLPIDCISVCNLWKYSSSRTRDYFIVKLTTFTTKHKDKFFSYKSEAQARAEALIWLIENHYIAAKDLKL